MTMWLKCDWAVFWASAYNCLSNSHSQCSSEWSVNVIIHVIFIFMFAKVIWCVYYYLFSFFSQTIHLLEEDNTIYCISAWNDQVIPRNHPSCTFSINSLEVYRLTLVCPTGLRGKRSVCYTSVSYTKGKRYLIKVLLMVLCRTLCTLILLKWRNWNYCHKNK